MRDFIYTIQLILSTLGFLFFSICSGIVGGYVIEYKKDPTIVDKMIFAFNSSSYPLYVIACLLWTVIILFLIWKRKSNIRLAN